MLRSRVVTVTALLAASYGLTLAGCSSSNTSTTSSSAAGGTTTVAPSTTAKAGTTATTATATTAKTGGTGTASGSTVNVTLTDTAGLNGSMTMTVSPTTVKAGKVTFVVKNSGTITHEMVVLKLEPGEKWDTLVVTEDKVSEAGSKGETGDVDAGDTNTFDVELTPGDYALVCNVEKHYPLGMRAGFTVT